MPEMQFFKKGLGVAVTAAAVLMTGAAQAAERPLSFSGNAWVAIAIILGLVVLIALMIAGVIGVSSRGETANDDGGTGLPFFGDDDEEDRPKRKR